MKSFSDRSLICQDIQCVEVERLTDALIEELPYLEFDHGRSRLLAPTLHRFSSDYTNCVVVAPSF